MTDLYSPSHTNGPAIIAMGGFTPLSNQVPPKPHVHAVGAPHSALHHQNLPSQMPSSGIPFANGGQVNMGNPQNVTLQSSFPQMVQNGGTGGGMRSSDGVTGQNSCKKRKTSDAGGPHSHGSNIKQEPGM